jgi:hypothetical protein
MGVEEQQEEREVLSSIFIPGEELIGTEMLLEENSSS